jgi:hypothetical protein
MGRELSQRLLAIADAAIGSTILLMRLIGPVLLISSLFVGSLQ